MRTPVPLGVAALALALAGAAACTGTRPAPAAPASQPAQTPRAYEYTPPPMPPPNEGDVHFMTGMIPHHAQAVKMGGWCASHGAREDLAILCERIVVGQRDEIRLMQTWLADRGLPVPAADATHMTMTMGGMEHQMLMPGMLTDEQMAALDRARGTEFDRLFLQGMIAHHQGAVDMVDELFSTPGAGQDEVVFRFASDVYADQNIEMAVMREMLASIGGGPA